MKSQFREYVFGSSSNPAREECPKFHISVHKAGRQCDQFSGRGSNLGQYCKFYIQGVRKQNRKDLGFYTGRVSSRLRERPATKPIF